MINMILNNFPNYKHNPLYVNVDEYVSKGLPLSELEEAGGSVVKTHYPQSAESKGHEEKIEKLLEKSKVILVRRNPLQVKQSLAKFGEWGKNEVVNFDKQVDAFDRYWDSQKNVLLLNYDDLISPSKFDLITRKLAEFLEIPLPERVAGPRPKKQRLRIFLDKALTRLLGARAPRINTGIKLGA